MCNFKSILIVASLCFLVEAKAFGAYPAFAQPRPERSIVLDYEKIYNPYDKINTLNLDNKIDIYFVYSHEKTGVDSIRFKNFIESKKMNKEIQQERDEALSKINLIMIDGDDKDQREKWKLPYFHTYYPLIKTSKYSKWMELPTDDRNMLLHPLWMVEWIKYQRALFLEDEFNTENYNGKSIDLYKKYLASKWIYKNHERGFNFLQNHGISISHYFYSNRTDTERHYSNFVSFLLGRTFSHVRRSSYSVIIDGKLVVVAAENDIYKYYSLYDLDLEAIHKDFPDFEYDSKYSWPVLKMNPCPSWTNKKLDISPEENVEIKNGKPSGKEFTFEEVVSEIGYGWGNNNDDYWNE